MDVHKQTGRQAERQRRPGRSLMFILLGGLYQYFAHLRLREEVEEEEEESEWEGIWGEISWNTRIDRERERERESAKKMNASDSLLLQSTLMEICRLAFSLYSSLLFVDRRLRRRRRRRCPNTEKRNLRWGLKRVCKCVRAAARCEKERQ